jgi:hypothetical protein
MLPLIDRDRLLLTGCSAELVVRRRSVVLSVQALPARYGLAPRPPAERLGLLPRVGSRSALTRRQRARVGQPPRLERPDTMFIQAPRGSPRLKPP